MVPGSRCLFKAIERLGKFTNMIRIFGVNKPLRLFHIDFLEEYSMQKCVGHIKLFEESVEVEGKC